MILESLKNVYTTLSQIEIRGEANVSYMYGALVTLMEVIMALENPKKDGD